MEQTKVEQDYERYQSYGYAEDLLPKMPSQRDWKMSNYVTLWMGAVHNIMSYMTVAGFFILGLNTKEVLLAVMLS